MTYGDILKQYKEANKNAIDYRPCVKPYFYKDLPEGVLVWLENGGRIIYIPKEGKEENNTMSNIKNAQIVDTMLGREDHGILTFMIFVQFGGGNVGIGGYALDQYDGVNKKRMYSPKSMAVISKILDVVGVNTWEDLKGKYIRVEDNGWGSPVTKIGNLMNDDWLDLKDFFSSK